MSATTDQVTVAVDSQAIQGKPAHNAMMYFSDDGEFTIDFYFQSRQPATHILVARIVGNARLAKGIYEALGEQLKKHEETFGYISTDEPRIVRPK